MGAVIASIGTTHPWNVAGVGADALVAAEYELRHVCAVAAVSAQDAGGVRAIGAIAADLLQAQLDALPDEVRVYRVGALATGENVRVVAEFLRERSRPAVVDPVLSATLGGSLQIDDDLAGALREVLLRLPVIVTPNLAECGSLLDLKAENVNEMILIAEQFVQRGASAALVKGGHLQGDPVDVLVSADGAQRFEGTRLPGSMRGSGCVLAAALACEIALGADLATAVAGARSFVREKIAASRTMGGVQVAF